MHQNAQRFRDLDHSIVRSVLALHDGYFRLTFCIEIPTPEGSMYV